jgi:hypothetical protein
MVDCRAAAMAGGATGAVDIAKVLQHILFWMSGVMRWNAVIMLAPTDSGTDIEQVLGMFDAVDDIVIQEGTYTFSRQSVDAKKYISHGPHKLHFRSVGGLLYLMRYPRESDRHPNAAFEIEAEWPTSWVEPTREWATTEWGTRARCPRTIMSIMQHSAPEQWMVAVVGLTHMVPSAVDNGRQRIMVFKGNEDIRADILSWLQTRQTSSVPVKRTTRATARDADEGDGTSSEQSPASEDIPVSPPLGNEGASEVDPSAGAVERQTVDWTTHAAIPEANPPMGVQRSNVVLLGSAAEDGTAPTVHSGGEGQVGVEEQEKIVAHVSTVNDDIMKRTVEVQSIVGTTPLGSTVREAGEWAQSISTLVYEAEGDYFVDRLNRMWVQDQPPPSVEVVGGDPGVMFQGNYFRRIEVLDLLQRQRSMSHPQNYASSTGVSDAAASLMFFVSGSSIGGSHTGDELERVLETPPE